MSCVRREFLRKKSFSGVDLTSRFGGKLTARQLIRADFRRAEKTDKLLAIGFCTGKPWISALAN